MVVYDLDLRHETCGAGAWSVTTRRDTIQQCSARWAVTGLQRLGLSGTKWEIYFTNTYVLDKGCPAIIIPNVKHLFSQSAGFVAGVAGAGGRLRH